MTFLLSATVRFAWKKSVNLNMRECRHQLALKAHMAREAHIFEENWEGDDGGPFADFDFEDDLESNSEKGVCRRIMNNDIPLDWYEFPSAAE